MCTNTELKTKLEMYISVSNEISKLEKLKKELSGFIVSEMDTRNENNDPALYDYFEGEKIITSRLSENVTKAGKAYLKEKAGKDIDTYINVSCSRFINTAAAKKLF